MVRPMPRRLVPAGMLAVTLVALMGGCGDDDEPATVTEEQTVTETQAPPEATTTAEEPPAQGNRGPRHFQTPSGNIGCYVDSSGARCDIAEREWSPPPAPSSCELDYGQGLTVDGDGASFVCAGDTTLGAPATLAYGASAQRERFLCESAEAGVTCTDTETGAGFFISRQVYRIF